jgi:hypothetical protein
MSIQRCVSAFSFVYLNRIAIPNTSTRHFSSLARRLSRIFAHAYFHHRELFEQAEAENALYERFLLLVQEFQLVPAEFLVIPWEGRPSRKPKAMQGQSFDRSYLAYGESLESTEDVPRDFARPGPIPRSILSRDQEADPNSVDDATLMASPSGGSLGRRRTDTMYLTGDLGLAALDPVLGGAQDEENLPDGELEGPQQGEESENVHADPAEEEQTELELAESVDPFKDDAEVATRPEPDAAEVPVDAVVVPDNDEQVLNVEEVVQEPVQHASEPLFEEEKTPDEAKDSPPEIEILEKEADEASEEGQTHEDLITEPPPTPLEEPEASEKEVEAATEAA